MATTEIQRDLTVEDDLTPYRGTWVAIRDGKVVANALDALELRDDPAVRENDWLLLVPSDLDGSFFL